MKWLPTVLGAALLWMLPSSVRSHELRPGFLEIQETGQNKFEVLWKVPAQGELRLSLYPRLPDDCQELTERTTYQMGDAHIQRWSIRCPDGLVGREIAIDGLSTLMTDVLARVRWMDDRVQTVRLDAAQTSFVVEEAPTFLQLATAYTGLGLEHILLGFDHLLFVVGLLLIVRSTRLLIETITAFTIAHSITLALAVLGFVDVPSGPVEATIALSIVFLAVEIVHLQRGRAGVTARLPWTVAFVFGLLHGLGFAGALSEIGLPPGDIPLALLCFNIGVELGQLVFVIGFVGLIWIVRKVKREWPQWTPAIPAYGIGVVATYWLLGRVLNMVSG